MLIYFDTETKREILGKIRRILRPGGTMLLGGSETTIHIDDNYERVRSAGSGHAVTGARVTRVLQHHAPSPRGHRLDRAGVPATWTTTPTRTVGAADPRQPKRAGGSTRPWDADGVRGGSDS